MTFINYDQEQIQKSKASTMAYRLRSLIAVAYSAFDNDCGSIEMENRGIDQALELAEKMACDLIDLCEEMEREVKNETGENA
ncbi:hypothetical protein SAMN05444000_1233 [Shimia gijangensis]|uniref:Uncharacterized protein n=1 Tax=Shimia gijangensis TaxID=1470563 RepID=A0A1M6QSJ7_9RHOB|nr:hypothetical protein [Shimia gijangensis]SHK23186.1 hypothetical protein SAMN05444000_1233 [Shimia gijangensis]